MKCARPAALAMLLCCVANAHAGRPATDAAGPTGMSSNAAAVPPPGSGDRVLLRRFVPDERDRHGEVRLLERGRIAVVQTVLYSRVLKRVVGEIVAKERNNWLPDSPGYRDSLAYQDALEEAAVEIWRRQIRSTDDHDRTQRMLIEFAYGPDACALVLSTLPADFVASDAPVGDATSVAELAPSCDYVRRNMVLIAADSLAMSESAARAEIERITRINGRGDGAESSGRAAKPRQPPAGDTSPAGSR